MSDDLKKEARRQYVHYFRIWFIITGILLVVTIATGIAYSARNGKIERENTSAPEERVYDYADVLTDEQEELLREYIAEKEEKYHADFVIMTFNQPVMGEEAKAQYGYRSTDWTQNMMDIADDFWDENGYGYNKDFEGDGSILIDNRYPVEHEGGEWLSTSGRVETALSVDDIDNILYAVDEYYDTDPYSAYMAYIDSLCGYLAGPAETMTGSFGYWLFAAVVTGIVAAIYAACHLGKNKAKNDVAVNAYVAGGRPVMHNKQDAFIRKNVVQRRIETSSSSGGSSGGGGHHVSSSGASHGGGGHRH